MLNKILELFIDIKARPSNKGTKAFKSTSYESLGDPTPKATDQYHDANSRL